MFTLPAAISFWKVRTSYTSVGNDTSAGQLQPDFYVHAHVQRRS
jgi:hypothetical protein